jgi:hypothetical protein
MIKNTLQFTVTGKTMGEMYTSALDEIEKVMGVRLPHDGFEMAADITPIWMSPTGEIHFWKTEITVMW